jgi:hypothetical protein
MDENVEATLALQCRGSWRLADGVVSLILGYDLCWQKNICDDLGLLLLFLLGKHWRLLLPYTSHIELRYHYRS